MRTTAYVLIGLLVVAGIRSSRNAPPVERPGGIGGGVVLLVLVGVLVVWAASRKARGSTRPAPVAHVHTHGRMTRPARRRFIARHEAGHIAVARAVGATRVTGWVSDDDDEGAVWADDLPGGAVATVAVARGGRKAVGSSWGCGGDRAIERAALKPVPHRERAAVRREADRIASRAVSRSRGQIRRDAQTLDKKGRL